MWRVGNQRVAGRLGGNEATRDDSGLRGFPLDRRQSRRPRTGSDRPLGGPSMTRSRLRLEVLKTLRDFLDGIGEGFWAEWVQIGIEDGRFPDVGRSTAPHHL